MKRSSICIFMTIALALSTTGVWAQDAAIGTSGTDIAAAGSRSQETSAGNFVADALKASTRADASLVAADTFTSASIARGPLNQSNLKSLLSDPDDEVAVVTLTGAQLRVAIERSVSVHPKPFDGFLQVAGINMEFDSGRAPGPRLMKITVAGAPLDSARKYRVAMPDTLAGGGLGYYRMWDPKDVQRPGKTILATVADYVKEQRTVSPKVEARLTAK